MVEFIELLSNFFWNIFDKLNKCTFDFDGYSINLTSLLFAFMVTGFVISTFWRGAKT